MHIHILNSLRYKLIIGVVIILIPLVALLIINNEYAISVVHSQVAMSEKNMIALYMNQIDNDLNTIDIYISRILALNNDFQIVEYSNNDYRYQQSKIQLYNTLSEDIKQYNFLDAVFIYSISKQDFFYATNIVSYEQNQEIARSLTDFIDSQSVGNDETFPDKWFVTQINNKHYILRILKSGDTYIGVWINADRLLIHLGQIDMQKDGITALIDMQGVMIASSSPMKNVAIDLSKGFNNYYITGNKDKYLVVGASSSKGGFQLVALIPNSSILQNLPYIQYISTIIAFLAILLIPVALLLIQRIVINPLQHLIATMKTIRNGNMEERIESKSHTEEFIVLNQAFNTMLDEIRDLKINVYEEKIMSQRAEFEQLRLQVNPHFFLNSLNMLYLMVETKNLELTKDMLLCLLGYFRYVLKDKRAFVYLKEELDHVRNYLHIQELRYPGKLFYIAEIPEYFNNIPVPPLIIQGFVENCVKYAYSPSQILTITIRVSLEDEENEPYVQIKIADTGLGFTEGILAELQNGAMITDEDGDHVGIWNTRKRLSHLYHDRAFLRFSNATDGGATVSILLPTQLNQEV